MNGGLSGSDAVLLKLRPPCARNTVIVHGFAREMYTNSGYTVRFPSVAEPATAMADGRVARVEKSAPFWRSDEATMGGQSSYGIAVDHGYGVESFVGGLALPEVIPGATVRRGQRLGLPLTREVYYQIRQGGAKRPASVSRHFGVYDTRYVPVDPQTVRFAPDMAPRDPGGTAPWLVNVDFYGDGAKRGRAAAGFGDYDYWNVYTPDDFTAVHDSVCGDGVVYSSNPVLALSDWQGLRSTAWIEKRGEAPLSFAGMADSWDPMLAGWVGGYDRYLPLETYFTVRGLPSTPLRVLFYSTHGYTSFFISVDGATGIARNSSYLPGYSEFVEGLNYVEFPSVTLRGGKDSTLGVKVLGYLAGMQIVRDF